jgi:hypothetical protein
MKMPSGMSLTVDHHSPSYVIVKHYIESAPLLLLHPEFAETRRAGIVEKGRLIENIL